METLNFLGLSNKDDLNKARETNRAQVERSIHFNAWLKSLEGGERPVVDVLRQVLFDEKRIHEYQSGELMQMFITFRGQKAFADMMHLVDACKDPEFSDAQIVREFYAVASNQIGEYRKTIEMAEGMIEDGHENGEVYGALGKAWLKLHDTAKEYLQAAADPATPPEKLAAAKGAYMKFFPDDPHFERVEKNKNVCLLRSKNNYEAGMYVAFEYYPGINAAYRMMDLGDFARAKKMARMVYMACQRDGARETMDYWCAATMMESACIMGADKAEIKEALGTFLTLRIEKWQLESTITTLERVRKTVAESNRNVEPFDMAIENLQHVLEHFNAAAFNEAAKKKVAKNITQAMHYASFNYRGLASNFVGANFISGNHAYGGQLPDHCLTRTDLEQFDRVLEAPLAKMLDPEQVRDFPRTLQDIDDPHVFLKTSSLLVRKAFGTDQRELEQLHSDLHKEYDDTVKGLIMLSGANGTKAADTRTNISVIMGIGLGDCRHHAQAYNALCDSWQKFHMTTVLKNAYQCLKVDDIDGYKRGMSKFQEIEAWELRTMDALVQAPVKTNGIYHVLEDETGRAIAEPNGKMNDVEDHTLTFLLHHDPDGSLKSIEVTDSLKVVSFSDSFYQVHYQWAEGEIPVSQLSMDENGKILIPAKTLLAGNEKGEDVYLPVQLRPTPYNTGKRDKVASDEHGRLLLMGIPVDKSFDLVRELSKTSEERIAALKHIHRWYIEQQAAVAPPNPQVSPAALSKV